MSIMLAVYVNDMMDGVTSYLSMFADYAKLLRQVSDVKDCEALQSDLDEIWERSGTWQIEFNRGP